MPRRKRHHLTLVSSRECELWPFCACHENLTQWQAQLESPEPLCLEAFDVAAWSVGPSLHCIAAHCPDREMRAFAKYNLRAPLWRFLTEKRDINESDWAAQGEYRRSEQQ